MVPASSPSVCYVVDTRASQFTVQAFASGLAAAVAHSPKIAIRDWDGEARFTPGTLTDASIRVRIKTASLEVLDEMRDSDRRELLRVLNGEVLETQRFPEVIFESSEARAERQKDDLYRLKVQGRWTSMAWLATTALWLRSPWASTARVLMANLNCSRPITAFGSLQSAGAR